MTISAKMPIVKAETALRIFFLREADLVSLGYGEKDLSGFLTDNIDFTNEISLKNELN